MVQIHVGQPNFKRGVRNAECGILHSQPPNISSALLVETPSWKSSLHKTTEEFIANAKLRDFSEILDEADLIYRYDWAAVNARVKKQNSPAGLDGGVVVERHRALNWLIGYMNQEWDDVTTDT